MNMKAALLDTLSLAHNREMFTKETVHELSYAHLLDMHMRVLQDEFSEAKLGRWLGWAQAAVVAAGCGTLDEMKKINKRHADDS